jgi:hypothetical protein
MGRTTGICGYCGEPVEFLDGQLNADDLRKGFDHSATRSDWGAPTTHPTRWRHAPGAKRLIGGYHGRSIGPYREGAQ